MSKKKNNTLKNTFFFLLLIAITSSFSLYSAPDEELANEYSTLRMIKDEHVKYSDAFKEILPEPTHHREENVFKLNDSKIVPNEDIIAVLIALNEKTNGLFKIGDRELNSAFALKSLTYTLTGIAVFLGAVLPPLLAHLQTLESPRSWLENFAHLSYKLPLEDVRLLCKPKELSDRVSKPFFMDPNILENILKNLQNELGVQILHNIQINSNDEATLFIEEELKKQLLNKVTSFIKVALNEACAKTETKKVKASKKSQNDFSLTQIHEESSLSLGEHDPDKESLISKSLELDSSEKEEGVSELEYSFAVLILNEENTPRLNKLLSFLKSFIWTTYDNKFCHSDSYDYDESCHSIELKL